MVKNKSSVKSFKKAQKTKTRKGKTKYNKIYIELWQCKSCEYEWAYRTQRCPLCAGIEPMKVL